MMTRVVKVTSAGQYTGRDIHRETAADMFDVRPEDVTDEQRRAAKVVSFGETYGMNMMQPIAITLDDDKGDRASIVDSFDFRKAEEKLLSQLASLEPNKDS